MVIIIGHCNHTACSILDPAFDSFTASREQLPQKSAPTSFQVTLRVNGGGNI